MNRKEIIKIAKDYMEIAWGRGLKTTVNTRDVVFAIEKYRRENNYPSSMIFALDNKGILSVNDTDLIALCRVWQPYYYIAKPCKEGVILSRNESEYDF